MACVGRGFYTVARWTSNLGNLDHDLAFVEPDAVNHLVMPRGRQDRHPRHRLDRLPGHGADAEHGQRALKPCVGHSIGLQTPIRIRSA